MMEPDPEELHVGGNLTKEQLEDYNYDYRTLRYTGIMETLMRYHTAASRRRRAAKWSLIKKPWEEPMPKFEDLMPAAVKEWFRIHQREAKTEYFQRLNPLGIPTSTGLMDILELEDQKKSLLGNRIWFYESKILKAFAPVNMSHRYRGTPNETNALKSIFFLGMSDDRTQAEMNETQRIAQNQQLLRADPFKFLQEVAKSETHYKFLKALAAAQLVTLPFSIQETCLEDVVPSFELVINYYSAYMSDNNQKLRQVQAHRSGLLGVLDGLKRL